MRLENIQTKSVHVVVCPVEFLESYGEGLGYLHNKLVPAPFIYKYIQFRILSFLRELNY